MLVQRGNGGNISQNAQVEQDELRDIMQSLHSMKIAALSVDEDVRFILRDIKDIFSVNFCAVDNVANVLDAASNICAGLDQAITKFEIFHSQYDFVNTNMAIEMIASTIQTWLRKGRLFKETYDPNNWDNANRKYQLLQLSAGLLSDLDAKAEAAKAAVEHHEARIEMENRIEFAKWEKLLVCAVVVVASAIVITALPVSGPLVVGLVNGVSSAIIDANNKAMDLYVVDGDLSGEDWAQVAVEGSRGYLEGLATGVVSGVAGKTISGLTKGIPAMQSGNMLVNTTTHVVVGSVTEVTTGVVSRATGEVVNQLTDGEEGFSWSDVQTKALDGGEMFKDGVTGGIGGYINGHKVDYSDSMHSDYEQGTLDDMYAKGELEYTVDPELDGANYLPSEELNYNMTPKKDTNFFEDYFIKNKDDNLTWTERITPDKVLSPDDYSREKYDVAVGANEAMKKGYRVLDKAGVVNETWEGGHDSKFKSHDEILNDIYKNNKEDGEAFYPGGGEGGSGGGVGGR